MLRDLEKQNKISNLYFYGNSISRVVCIYYLFFFMVNIVGVAYSLYISLCTT